jgi:hypothetical protein
MSAAPEPRWSPSLLLRAWAEHSTESITTSHADGLIRKTGRSAQCSRRNYNLPGWGMLVGSQGAARTNTTGCRNARDETFGTLLSAIWPPQDHSKVVSWLTVYSTDITLLWPCTVASR